MTDLGFGVVIYEKYTDRSLFGIGFDVDDVCEELKSQGFTDVNQLHVKWYDPTAVRLAVYHVGRATVVYDDNHKVVRVKRGS